MMSERVGTALLLTLFLIVGALAWSIQLRQELSFDASSLQEVPRTIGDWGSRDIPVESYVESMLNADFNLQRVYRNRLGDIVWLYIGFYGTERGGKPEHTPTVCYQAHGWQIQAERPLRVGGDPEFNATEYVVEQGGERRLVLFWFRSSRSSGPLSFSNISLDHMLNRIANGRADGSLIRLSTPLASLHEAEARSRLLSFAETLSPLLGATWPVESPIETGRR